jgi:hypothetical protein
MSRTRSHAIVAGAAAVLAAAIVVVACFLYLSAPTPTSPVPPACSNSTTAPQPVVPGGGPSSRGGCLGVLADEANNCAGSATLPEILAPGWNASYRAGCYDAAGNLMGGSEIMHLVGHDGMLFAAVGYWEDTANINYGGNNSSVGWAQILRLDAPNGRWQVDLTMNGVLRPDILDSVTFTTNGTGVPLSHPVSLLVTAACRGSAGADLYTRNDTTGQWATSTIVSTPTGPGCDARADALYRDPITGVDRLFVSLGDLGIYSGVYDPAAPGDILWNHTSESGRVAVRPLAITEANGNLFCSSGALVYERVNGPSPSWQLVVNETDLPGGTAVDPADGGIRGLSAIPNPNGPGQSLLFLWVPGNESKGLVVRLDPNGSGGYTSTNETSLAPLASQYLSAPAAIALGAYNNILPVTDPATGDGDYIIGLQTWVHNTTGLPRMWWGNASGGTYEGALYAIRDSNGSYRMGEINGRFPAGNPPLEAIRSYVLSPFPSDHGNVIYFGGYDADGYLCNNTAWVFRTTIANALGEATYPASIEETGLPQGTSWSVALNGTNETSSNSTIEFNETNGTYSYTITSVPGYIATPDAGALEVAGGAVVREVNFTRVPPPQYTVAFQESGLTSGATWSVTFNWTPQSTSGPLISFTAANGSYPFSIGSITGYVATPASGILWVTGANVSRSINYTPRSNRSTNYTITFSEAQLPSGTTWSVTLNGSDQSSSIASMIFSEPNGTYPFTIGSVPGYSSNVSSGLVTVAGTPTTVSVVFHTVASASGGASVAHLTMAEWIFSGAALAAIAGVMIALVIRGRARKGQRREARDPNSIRG